MQRKIKKSRQALINRTSKIIRHLRIEVGISQVEFAKKLNLTTAAVWQWENGICAPTYSSIEKLDKFFKKYGMKFNKVDFFEDSNAHK